MSNEGQNLYNELKQILINQGFIVDINNTTEYKSKTLAIEENHVKIAKAAHLLISSKEGIIENNITIANAIQNLLSSDAAHKFNKVLNETDIDKLIENNPLLKNESKETHKNYQTAGIDQSILNLASDLENMLDTELNRTEVVNSSTTSTAFSTPRTTSDDDNNLKTPRNQVDNEFYIKQTLQEAKNNLINKKELTKEEEEAARKIYKTYKAHKDKPSKPIDKSALVEDLNTALGLEKEYSQNVLEKEEGVKKALINKTHDALESAYAAKNNVLSLNNQANDIKNIQIPKHKPITPIKIEPTKEDKKGYETAKPKNFFRGKATEESKAYAKTEKENNNAGKKRDREIGI